MDERRDLSIWPAVTYDDAAAARRWLAGQIAGRIIPGADLLGADGRRLEERLREAPGWDGLGVLIGHLLSRVPDRPRDNLGAQVWEWATARGGRVTVRDLALTSGWSVRHLSGSVRRETGLGPKAIGRLARFESTVAALGAGGSIAAVAADCGYADQAHLTREWRRLAGVTPTE